MSSSKPHSAHPRNFKSRHTDSTSSSPPTRWFRSNPRSRQAPISQFETCHINFIPVELLIHILSQLEPASLSIAGQVCRYWRRIVKEDDGVWRDAFVTYFNGMPFRRLVNESWKSEYIERTRLLRKWEKGRGTSILFDPRVGNVDALHVDFQNSWMLAASLSRGAAARCNPDTGKVDRDLIYANEDQTFMSVACVKIDSHRILWGYEHGGVGLTSRTKSMASRQLRLFTDVHRGAVNTLAWSSSINNVVASGGADGIVKVWDVASGLCVRNLVGSSSAITSLILNPRYHTIAGTKTGEILIWDLDTIPLLTRLGSDTPITPHITPTPSVVPTRRIPSDITSPILSIEYDSLTSTFIVARKDQPFPQKYDANTGRLITIFDSGHIAAITCLEWDCTSIDPSFSSSISTLSSSAKTPNMPQNVHHQLERADASDTSVRFSGEGHVLGTAPVMLPTLIPILQPGRPKLTRVLVTGDTQGWVCLWNGDAENREDEYDMIVAVKPILKISAHTWPITSLHLDALKLITGGEDGTIKTWDPISGRFLRAIHSRYSGRHIDPTGNERMPVRCIFAEKYRGVAAIGGAMKSWDYSPIKATSDHKNKKMKKKYSGAFGSPRAQIQHEIKHEIRESRSAIAYETKLRQHRAEKAARENPIPGLDEEELVAYALMLSRDDTGGATRISAGEEEDLVRAVIDSLEGVYQDEHEGEEDGAESDTASLFSRGSSVSSRSGFYTPGSSDGRTAIGLSAGSSFQDPSSMLDPTSLQVAGPSVTLSSSSRNDTHSVTHTGTSPSPRQPINDYEDETLEEEIDDLHSQDIADEWSEPTGRYNKRGEFTFRIGGGMGGELHQKSWSATRTTPATEHWEDEYDEELQFVLQLSKEDM